MKFKHGSKPYELNSNDRRLMTALAEVGYVYDSTYLDCVWMVREKKNYIPRFARISRYSVDFYSDEGNYFLAGVEPNEFVTKIKLVATTKYMETTKGTHKGYLKEELAS
jgi:hypothetical protein